MRAHLNGLSFEAFLKQNERFFLRPSPPSPLSSLLLTTLTAVRELSFKNLKSFSIVDTASVLDLFEGSLTLFTFMKTPILES